MTMSFLGLKKKYFYIFTFSFLLCFLNLLCNCAFEQSHVEPWRDIKAFIIDITTEPSYLALDRATRSHLDWLRLLRGDSSLDMVSLGEKTLTEYRHAMHAMRDRVASTLSKYDLHAMAVGIVGVWMVSITVLDKLRTHIVYFM